jgi:hypothetical protein
MIPITRSIEGTDENIIKEDFEVAFNQEEVFTPFNGKMYHLAGFLIHQEKHLMAFVKVKNCWFQMDDSSSRRIDLPMIAIIFAKYSVLAMYVNYGDIHSHCSSQESLPGAKMLVNVEDYNVIDEPSIFNTVASFKAYIPNISLGLKSVTIFFSTGDVPISSDRCFDDFDETFFVCHFENRTVDEDQRKFFDDRVIVLVLVTEKVKLPKKGEDWNDLCLQQKIWYRSDNNKFACIDDDDGEKTFFQIANIKSLCIKSAFCVLKSKISAIHAATQVCSVISSLLDTRRQLATKQAFKGTDSVLLKDISSNDYAFTTNSSSEDLSDFTRIACVVNDQIYLIENPLDQHSKYWAVKNDFPGSLVDLPNIKRSSTCSSIFIRTNKLADFDVKERVRQIVEHSVIRKVVLPLLNFFDYPGVTDVEYFSVDSNESIYQLTTGKNLLVIYRNKMVGAKVGAKKGSQEYTFESFDTNSRTVTPPPLSMSLSEATGNDKQAYNLMAYLSVPKKNSEERNYFVRFNVSDSNFESMESMSPYSIPSYELKNDSQCFILLYIADNVSCREFMQTSILKNSVIHMTDFFSPLKRLITDAFDETNVVNVPLSETMTIDESRALLLTIISEANTPTMFCIILKRVRKDLPWHYPDIFSVPGNDVKYVLTAIGQHIEHKKSKGGLSISKKIWRRLDEGVFINTPIEQHVSLLTWTDETQTIIQKQGVAFLYKLHTA